MSALEVIRDIDFNIVGTDQFVVFVVTKFLEYDLWPIALAAHLRFKGVSSS